VAEITIRGVTAALKYPSADSLEDIERDALITKMMNYLQEKKADDLAKHNPTWRWWSLATEASELAYAERELEEVFKYSLMFTETEGIWFGSFCTINPSDFY